MPMLGGWYRALSANSRLRGATGTLPLPCRVKAGLGWRVRLGFTMLELLMVVAIIGIMAMMIVPTVTGSDIARVRTATRGLMQMSRYTRTMAILRQQTLTLEISTDGTLRVTGATDVVAPSQPEVDVAAEAESIHITTQEEAAAERALEAGAGGAGAGGGGGKGNVMSETNTERVFKQVRFVVELDEDELDEDELDTELDAVDSDEDTDEEGNDIPAVRTVRITYEGNGRCLPYRVTIYAEGTDEDQAVDKAVVIVDRFGNAKVLDEDE